MRLLSLALLSLTLLSFSTSTIQLQNFPSHRFSSSAAREFKLCPNLIIKMVENFNTTTPLSDNTAHENEAGSVDKSIIGKIWKRSVIAEQQLNLLRSLAKLKLGVKEVEEKLLGKQYEIQEK